jgi:hypothetical protein
MDDIVFETEDMILNTSLLPLGSSGISGFSMDGEAFDYIDCENQEPVPGLGESAHIFVT